MLLLLFYTHKTRPGSKVFSLGKLWIWKVLVLWFWFFGPGPLVDPNTKPWMPGTGLKVPGVWWFRAILVFSLDPSWTIRTFFGNLSKFQKKITEIERKLFETVLVHNRGLKQSRQIRSLNIKVITVGNLGGTMWKLLILLWNSALTGKWPKSVEGGWIL